MIQNELSQIVVEFLKLDADDISLDKILLDLGFDSIGLATYANAINEKYKLDVTPVLFFEYPSIREIAKYLYTEHNQEVLRFHKPSHAPASARAVPPAARPATGTGNGEPFREIPFAIRKGRDPGAFDQEATSISSGDGFSPEHRFVNQPIAVVGMSGVMPQSEDLEEFWENLRNAENLITVIPRDRWNWEDYYGDPIKEENKSNSKWGGFMKEVDKFDPLFFGISPREAEMMDPQQRIFLETVWKAIEDSGYKVSDLSGTKTGLFVGVATNDYADLLTKHHIAIDGYTASGNSHSVLVNRVSFLLNLRGPSAPLDTACSSSLIAIHRAIESIHTGSCDMAIVGGVQLMLSPAAYISFGKAGMLSDDGKCKTFDKRANGYVRGEGSGAIFLKPLSIAEADGNHVYAVIKATAENHGGRVTMLTAPNPNAQTELLIKAYEKAQIDPTTVSYIECHGTGTSLGDPIETQALTKSFFELYKKHHKKPPETPHCGLGTVKTNIGHLETAAGIASMLKVLLAIKHKQIPASLHFEELNPYINLKGSPFYIVDKTMPWEAIQGEDGSLLPRRAGVSSFGFGGANAHIVLEEYLPQEHQSSHHIQGPHAIVLSAKNQDRLNAYARLMLAYIKKYEIDLADFAYTLQVGRDAMTERLGFVVTSAGQLAEELQAYVDGKDIENAYQGRVSRKKDGSSIIGLTGDGQSQESIIEKWFAGKNLSRLLDAWVKGLDLDWSKLYGTIKPKRISLPTYPFARERYWINTAGSGQIAKPGGAAALLHPLLHSNTSVIGQQSYSSTFTGKEFFLSDHQIAGQRVLPVVAYLEMARAAVEHAKPAAPESGVLELRDAAWTQPLVVKENKQINIALFENGDGQIDYEIFSSEAGEEIIHCQGNAVFRNGSESARLDIEQLKGHMTYGMLDTGRPDTVLKDMGMHHGALLQGFKAIYRGDRQMLAHMSLPDVLENSQKDYILHPSLMNSSLQAAIGLMTDLNHPSGQPLHPSGVESVRIISPCVKEMYAWVRYSRGSRAGDRTFKLDIDLTDSQGRICAKLKSLTFNNNASGAEHSTRRSDFEFLLDSINTSSHTGIPEIYETEDYTNVFENILDNIH